MNVLLDTQIVLWLVSSNPRLTSQAELLIDAAENRFVSAASIWEIAIKVKIGKLQADPEEVVLNMRASGFQELIVHSNHAAQVAKLPLHHGDPFDRLLIAQAIHERLRLITTDNHLAQYSDLVIQV